MLNLSCRIIDCRRDIVKLLIIYNIDCKRDSVKLLIYMGLFVYVYGLLVYVNCFFKKCFFFEGDFKFVMNF